MTRRSLFIPNVIPEAAAGYLAARFDLHYRNNELPPTTRGIIGTNTPGVLTETTADFAFALLMAAARRVAEADAHVKQRKWENWTPNLLLGQDIYGAMLGIIGMGKIGSAVARRASGFAMKTLYFNRRRNLEVERELGVQYAPTLQELLSASDFIVILTPLSLLTKKLIGDREFALMKPSAILINAARGPIVDEGALIRAIEQGTIAGAAVDVYEHEPTPSTNPLLQLPTVVTTPHIGSATHKTRQKMAMLAAENLTAALTGVFPPNIVNPEVWDSA